MMNLLSLFTGGWKKNSDAVPAPAPPVAPDPVAPCCPATSLEERQQLLAHHVRLVARGMANGLCVYGNCYNALATLPEVDPARVGVVGHSFGGKWAMFASCLYEKFACAVWCDPGIVFDEKRPNVNYWEPWYLGWESQRQRKPGVPTESNLRTGPYKQLFEAGHDLHELHALMAPRPFLVSGGSEDPPERWKALNHSIAVHRLLGYENRVAMTNRPAHSPTEKSNEQVYLFFEHFLKHTDHPSAHQ